uniref:R13L1/DRL21-like LRR repeat region domain-containing protein n=1 Tax=Oryza punctata TaxID=4537 RepID=A0A0E0LDX8_ORYPU
MSARYTGFQSVLKMHDLVHELASAVADEQVCIFHAGDRSSSNTGNHCHYLFVSNFNESSQVSILPDRARALHFKECGKFPETLSGTKFLRVLDSSACTIDKLPDSISQLRLLKYLNVSGMISGKLPKLRKLHLLQALTLSKITDLVELPSYICEFLKLHYLDLHGCSNLLKLPEDIDKLKELQHLNLSHCTSIESLPSFSSLSGGLQKLSFLNVSHCSQLRKVHDNYLPNMIDLNMSFCPELQELPTGLFKHMNMLVFLNFAGCASLEVLPELVEDGTGCFMLEVLDLSGCANLHALPNSCCQLIELRFLNLSGCYQLENIMKWILRWKFLGKLEYLNLSGVGAKGDSEAQGTSSRDLESSHDSNKELALMTMLQKDITVVWLRLKYLSIGGFTLYSEQGNIGRDAKLGDLLTLPNFHVRQQDDGECSNILLLQQILDPTHHQLNIKCLQNVVLPEEAKQLELDRKPQFHSLSFEWSLSRDETQTSRHLGLDRDRERMHRPRARTMPGSDYFDEDEEAISSCQNEHQAKASAVLDNLRPHRNLESLSIKGYISNEFPDWVKKINDTLPYLVKLILSDIEECDYIPAFGHLPNLQELEINNMPMLRDARIGQCMKLRRLTLVALPNGATVNLFYNANIQKEVQTVESCHGFDEEMRETRQEFDMLAGQRACGGPSKFTSKRVHKLRARLNIGTSGRTREKASALSEESKLPPKLSHGCTGVASKAFLELDYLKIEKCNDLNLHPSFPKSKEYFIKDSSLHYLALQNEYTSSFPSEISYSRYSEHPYSQQGTRIPLQEHAMLQSNPGLKSKMHVEGSEEYHFHKWAELITTHLDELIVTHWIYNTRDMHSKAERIIGENDSMENIYGLSQPCIAKLKKFNLRSHSVDQHSQPRSTDNERTCETFIGKNGSQVPYINIGEGILSDGLKLMTAE